MFAPSTIAISAIILSFSTFRIDCKPWLDCVPNKCFRREGSYIKDSLLLDIDKCLDTFQRIESINHTLPKYSQEKSPISVIAYPPSPFTLLIHEDLCCTDLCCTKLHSHIRKTISSSLLDRETKKYSSVDLNSLDIEAIENDSPLNSPAAFYK